MHTDWIFSSNGIIILYDSKRQWMSADIHFEYKIFSVDSVIILILWCFSWQISRYEVISNFRLHYTGIKFVFSAWAPFYILRCFRLQILSSLSPSYFFLEPFHWEYKHQILPLLQYSAPTPLLQNSFLWPPYWFPQCVEYNSKTLLISDSHPKRQVFQLCRDKLAVLPSSKDSSYLGSKMVCH